MLPKDKAERAARIAAEMAAPVQWYVAQLQILALMRRLGITPARLRRHAWKSARIPRQRVDAVLAGDKRKWTGLGLWEWEQLVSGAWQAD